MKTVCRGEGESRIARRFLSDFVSFVFLTTALFLVFKGTVAEARYIPSSSMEPTLRLNDRLLVEKISARIGALDRGDVIVFYPPPIELGHNRQFLADMVGGLPFCPGNPAFIKRVVGLPGDVIEIERGVGVFVNGKRAIEKVQRANRPAYSMKYLGDIGGYSLKGKPIHPYRGETTGTNAVVVPEGHVFVLGDNINNSSDSHVWGFLNTERIIGKACFFLWRDAWLGQK